eukprot:8399257-Pyramimonas_sp.AAC.1
MHPPRSPTLWRQRVPPKRGFLHSVLPLRSVPKFRGARHWGTRMLVWTERLTHPPQEALGESSDLAKVIRFCVLHMFAMPLAWSTIGSVVSKWGDRRCDAAVRPGRNIAAG